MATATIVSITGQAWARDEAGNLRELSIGDVLQEGETLITSSNGSVELDFADGTGVSRVEGAQEVVVTPDLVGDLIVATDASVQDDDLEALLAALDDEDGDLLDLLDATAAGGAGAGGGGGGSDFVRLARIAEETDSLSFETSGGLGEGEFIDFGGAPDAEAAEADEPEPTPEPNTSPTITVTAAGAFNENDAQVGTVVATFTASDEEDGTLTVGNGGVDFTPGTNSDGYYAFNGENVTLTQAGVDAINAGATLPPVSLTATDSGDLTATDSDTPTYTAQNDGPTIDVTAEPVFNENEAEVGTVVATFTASDEEDGVLTVANGGVDFTPGSNDDDYYAFDGENVVLTQAGVNAINAGTTLPPVSLTATDSGTPALTATDSDTPTYTAQNDGPTIDVTAVDTFNENDAQVGTVVATFTASDEEDGTLTVGNGDVAFTPGTNGDGYYAFDDENVVLTQAGVDAINAGTTLPAVDLTATDRDNATARDSDTPNYVINSVVAISEEGLDNGIPDTGAGAGYSDTTNLTTAVGTLSIPGDTSSSLTVSIDLTSLPTGLASGGEGVTWDYLGGNQAIAVGSTSNGEVIRIELNDGNTSVANPSATSSVDYEVTLSAPVDHPENSLEDTLNFDFDVDIVDDNNASSTGTVTVAVEDDMPNVNADSNDLNVIVNELAVGGLSVAWSNVSGANGGVLNNQPAGQDDVISWGGNNGKSNYTFDDNNDLIANKSVSVNSMFELGEFTHNNFVVSQSINSVDLDLSLNVLINGYSATIKHTINFDHNETSNSGADPRDIVTIKNASTIVPVEITNENGEIETYNFQIIGFVDQDNKIVSEVFTNENASNSYKLMGQLVSSDAPDAAGQVEYDFGADGPADEEAIVWNDGRGVINNENGAFEVQGEFGVLTVDANGNYTYQLDQAAYDKLQDGSREKDTFNYTLKDADGDSVESTLEINITGEAAPQRPNLTPEAEDQTVEMDIGSVSTNLLFTLDVSGSMNDKVAGTGKTRFEIAKESLISTIASYNELGGVNVSLTLFGKNALNIDWMSAKEATDYISSLSLIGSGYEGYSRLESAGTRLDVSVKGTDYKDALETTENTDFSEKGADQTIAYFLSDGEPNENERDVNSDNDQAIQNWKNFINTNADELHVIGIGSNISDEYLEHVQVINGKVPLIVNDESQLEQTLTNTAQVSVTGDASDNITGGDGLISFTSITVGGRNYTADNFPEGGVQLDGQGNLKFDFETGQYTYSAGAGEFASGVIQKQFSVSVADEDGDSNSLSITINVTSGSNVDANMTTAQLVDGTVEGAFYYTSSGLVGMTDQKGTFEYREGDSVTFSVGGLAIGTVSAEALTDGKVFLQELADVALHDLNDEYVENLAVFLQSLDADSNAYNGITITAAMHAAFEGSKLDLRTASEDDLKVALEEVGGNYVNEEAAMQHVRDMLEEHAGVTQFEEHTDDSIMTAVLAHEAMAGLTYQTSSGLVGDLNQGEFTFNEGDTVELFADGQLVAAFTGADVGSDGLISFAEAGFNITPEELDALFQGEALLVEEEVEETQEVLDEAGEVVNEVSVDQLEENAVAVEAAALVEKVENVAESEQNEVDTNSTNTSGLEELNAAEKDTGQLTSDSSTEHSDYTLAEDEPLFVSDTGSGGQEEGKASSDGEPVAGEEDNSLSAEELFASDEDSSVDSWLPPSESSKEDTKLTSTSSESQGAAESESSMEHMDYVKLHNDYATNNSDI